MNKFYIIIPAILLTLFGGIYWQHSQEATQAAREKATATAQAKIDADNKKSEAERVAREDAGKREAVRAAEEKKKETEKRAKWDSDSVRIAEDTARYTAKAAEISAQVKLLEKQLADLRTAKKTANDEVFAAAHEAELMLIQKRTAELEIQRMTEMVARKAGNTTLAGGAP